ncbi:MAG: hypothetical protein LUC41_01460 [Clostridiales bacterium]|nr:hypothetical protein [Clostridiales bacterium]
MRRKIVALLCVVSAVVFALTGCSLFSNITVSTIELNKKGSVTETTIEDFPESQYDADYFASYVDDAVADYLEDNEDAAVEVKKDEVEDDIITLTMDYDSVDTYAAFNNVECFSGTISVAIASGYDFSVEFISAEDADNELSAGSEQETVSGSTVTSNSDLSVFIVRTTANVKIPGKVKYFYSEYGTAALEAKDTVAVTADDDTPDTGGLVYVLYE